MQSNTISPLKSLRWYYSVSIKIARIVPGYTLALIALTLVSQMSLLAASFLPLKAIILIGSPDIPGYFPNSWKTFGRENLFIALSFSAVVVYMFHLAAEKLIKYFTETGSQQLLANSSKMILFQEQEHIANRAYLRFTRSLASAAFVSCTILLLGVLYNDLMLTILILWIALIASYFCIKATHKKWHEKFLKIINETPNILASVGFLAAFGFMTFDFLDDNPPEILAALISLLLTRQLMQRVAILAQDTSSLLAQKLQVTALFFHSHRATANINIENDGFWQLLSGGTRDELITTLLRDVTAHTYKVSSVCWHQMGVHDIAAFEISAQRAFSASTRHFLIKIFNTKRSIFAINEATLLADETHSSLPTLPFVGTCVVRGFHCHVFECNSVVKVDPLHTKEPSRLALKSLMSSIPSPPLTKLFSRSHPSLFDRLSPEKLSNFTLATRMTLHATCLDSFLAARKKILSTLKNFPLQIANFDIGKDHLLTHSCGEIRVSHWGLWSVEPVGAGWPTSSKELQQLPFLFEEIRESRCDMAHVSFLQFKLSVLLSALDRFLAKQHFIYAAQLLPEIMNTYYQHVASKQQEVLH